MCLAQVHNTAPILRFKTHDTKRNARQDPAIPLSQVKHSTTQPLCLLTKMMLKIDHRLS